MTVANRISKNTPSFANSWIAQWQQSLTCLIAVCFWTNVVFLASGGRGMVLIVGMFFCA